MSGEFHSLVSLVDVPYATGRFRWANGLTELVLWLGICLRGHMHAEYTTHILLATLRPTIRS